MAECRRVGVVEPFDVLEDAYAGLDSGPEAGPVQEFGREAGEERLGDGVVIRVASPAHRYRDAGPVFMPVREIPISG